MKTVSRKPNPKSWLTLDLVGAWVDMDHGQVREFLKSHGWLRKTRATTPTPTALNKGWIKAYQAKGDNFFQIYVSKKEFLAFCALKGVPVMSLLDYQFNVFWEQNIAVLERYGTNPLDIFAKTVHKLVQQYLPDVVDHAFYLKLEKRFKEEQVYELTNKAWDLLISCLPMHQIEQEILQKQTPCVELQSNVTGRRL